MCACPPEDRYLLPSIGYHLSTINQSIPPPSVQIAYTKRSTFSLTDANFSRRGVQPLKQTIPPSCLSLVSPVSKLIVAPWLNPPKTTREAESPLSTSSVIREFKVETVLSMPSSSSSRPFKPNSLISNLI